MHIGTGLVIGLVMCRQVLERQPQACARIICSSTLPRPWPDGHKSVPSATAIRCMVRGERRAARFPAGSMAVLIGLIGHAADAPGSGPAGSACRIPPAPTAT